MIFPVIGTSEEPIKGWIDNLYGPTGVVVGKPDLKTSVSRQLKEKSCQKYFYLI